MEYISVRFRSPIAPYPNVIGFASREKFVEASYIESVLNRRFFLIENCTAIFEQHYHNIFKFDVPMSPKDVFSTFFLGAGYKMANWEDPYNGHFMMGFVRPDLEDAVNTHIYRGNLSVPMALCPFVFDVTKDFVAKNIVDPGLNLQGFFEELFAVSVHFENQVIGIRACDP